ncbi:hypothetical protein MPSEU_000913600 [Mayamaea pseudoterrestris]|nr:hypothetical protein MPSEU_000913600 [Mayamaea pseudoterrestris]
MSSEGLSFAREDCRRLVTALKDALRDLKMYSDDEESLETLIESDLYSLNLAKKLLGGMSDCSSWDQLVSRASNMPPWLTGLFLEETPQHSSKLEALLFMAMTLQQERLNCRKDGETEIPTDVIEHVPTETMEPKSKLFEHLPDFLSEKQRIAIQSCYTHLQADYDNRRNGLYMRMGILETSFTNEQGPTYKSTTQEAHAPALCTSAESLLDHFSKAHSIASKAAHMAAKSNGIAARSVATKDRGGRLDDVSRVEMPEWTEAGTTATKPTNGKTSDEIAGNSKNLESAIAADHQQRKRGNGDPNKPHSPRKKNTDSKS